MFVNLLIAIAFIIIWFTLGYWAQDRKPPIRVIDEVTDTPVVKWDDYLQITYKIQRFRQCSLVLEHDIFDGKRVRHRLDTQEFLTSPGPVGMDNFALVVEVTRAMAPGKATYRSVRSYYCNPLQRWFTWPIVVNPDDIEFTIVDAPPAHVLSPPHDLTNP